MLLNYAVYSNPTSHKDVISKVVNFAVTQGWTLQDQQLSKEWLYDTPNVKYDWLAGSEDYYWISSTGHGSQNINMRFRCYGTGVDPQAEQVDLYSINPTDTTIDDQIATHPSLQNSYTGSIGARMSMSPGTSTKLWVFGNSWFLFAFNQLAPDFGMPFSCGTLDPFDSAETEMIYCAVGEYSAGVFPKWYDYQTYINYFILPFNTVGNDAGSNQYYPWWWEGRGWAQTKTRPNNAFLHGDSWYQNFNTLAEIVRFNTYTGKRVILKPTIWAKHDTTDGLWRPQGTFPIYHMIFNNLQIGEALNFGGETYLCFPNAISSRKYGCCVRIV